MVMRLSATVIYGSIFALSIGFTYLAQEALRKGRKNIFIVNSFWAILIPCILAGLRAESVGTDTHNYLVSLTNSFAYPLFSLFRASALEFGLAVLGRISYYLGLFKFNFLFLAQLFTILPVYIASYMNWKRTRASITMAMMVYLFIFYGMSFNIMGQSIASAFLLLAYQFYVDKKKVKCLIFCGIAIAFHSSAVIALLMYAALLFLSGRERRLRTRIISVALLIGAVIFFIYYWDWFVNQAITRGLLPETYRFYLNIFSGVATYNKTYFFDLSPVCFLERGCFIIILLVGTYNRKKVRAESGMFFFDLAILTSVLINWTGLLFLHTYYGYRITLSVDYLVIPLIASLFCLIRKRRFSLKRIGIFKVFISLFLLFYFLTVYIVFGGHVIMPYSVSIF